LFDSREQAAQAIVAGQVLVSGAVATKASRLVADDEPVVVRGDQRRFVSRGGDKLDAALTRFGTEVTGRRALDAGASTGGFVDCLLQRGAACVVAVDVGRGQLHQRLRDDLRVVVLEGRNIRSLAPAALGPDGAVDLLTADLSFISLRTVASALAGLIHPEGELVVLVKPQFEAGRAAASRGKGVISDPRLWHRAVLDAASALQVAGTGIMGVMASPLRGAAGNVEFFLHARCDAPARADEDLGALVEAAVASVATPA
jgi:23S rRNA (cytidine1920-2'-O)/16S rRNA (cytidine1409-2'-O)-methyltransferase